MSGDRFRRPGGRWRLLVHEFVGKQPDGTLYGTSHHVTNQPGTGGPFKEHHELPAACEFDELVVGDFLHVEQMDASRYWVNVGGVTVWVTVDRDGRPKDVSVYGPDDYDAPREGCTYSLKWAGAFEAELEAATARRDKATEDTRCPCWKDRGHCCIHESVDCDDHRDARPHSDDMCWCGDDHDGCPPE